MRTREYFKHSLRLQAQAWMQRSKIILLHALTTSLCPHWRLGLVYTQLRFERRRVELHLPQPCGMDGLPRTLHTTALDGLRSIANLWIIAFHSLCFMINWMCRHEFQAIAKVTWSCWHFPHCGSNPHCCAPSPAPPTAQSQWLLSIGYLVVDAFLVLTGFLLGLQFMRKAAKASVALSKRAADGDSRASALERTSAASDEQAGCCSRHEGSWYRRFVRIMPPIALALVLHCLVLFPGCAYNLGSIRNDSRASFARFMAEDASCATNGCELWWTHLLHLQSIAPYGGTLIHTWNLTTQYTFFYLLFPLVARVLALHKSWRLPAFVTVVLALGSLARAVTHVHLRMLPAGGVFLGMTGLWWYMHPFNRMGVLYIGVLLAWILHSWHTGHNQTARQAVDWLLSAATLPTALRCLAPAAFVAFLALTAPDAALAPSIDWHMLVHVGSIGSALAWSWLVGVLVLGAPLLRSHKTPQAATPPSMATQVLAHKAWRPMARLSYLAYLLHPMLQLLLYRDPALLMPDSTMPLPVPRPVLHPHASSVANMNMWLNGTWPAGILAADGAGAGMNASAVQAVWGAVPSPEDYSPDPHIAAEWGETVAKCWPSAPHGPLAAVARLEVDGAYPDTAPRIPAGSPPTVAWFWPATVASTLLVFAVCWVLDALVVTPLTTILLSNPVHAVLRWPVLAYNWLVLVLGVALHLFVMWWLLVFVHPGLELGSAGVIHDQGEVPWIKDLVAWRLQRLWSDDTPSQG